MYDNLSFRYEPFVQHFNSGYRWDIYSWTLNFTLLFYTLHCCLILLLNCLSLWRIIKDSYIILDLYWNRQPRYCLFCSIDLGMHPLFLYFVILFLNALTIQLGLWLTALPTFVFLVCQCIYSLVYML